jgi:hypothetical protein
MNEFMNDLDRSEKLGFELVLRVELCGISAHE